MHIQYLANIKAIIKATAQHYARRGLPYAAHRPPRALSQALAPLAITLAIVVLPMTIGSLPVGAKPMSSDGASKIQSRVDASTRTPTTPRDVSLRRNTPPQQQHDVAAPTARPKTRYPRRSRQSLTMPYFSFAP